MLSLNHNYIYSMLFFYITCIYHQTLFGMLSHSGSAHELIKNKNLVLHARQWCIDDAFSKAATTHIINRYKADHPDRTALYNTLTTNATITNNRVLQEALEDDFKSEAMEEGNPTKNLNELNQHITNLQKLEERLTKPTTSYKKNSPWINAIYNETMRFINGESNFFYALFYLIPWFGPAVMTKKQLQTITENRHYQLRVEAQKQAELSHKKNNNQM